MKTVYSIQVLRGVAALLVVFYHAAANLHDVAGFRHLPVPAWGASGVDLFFVISGFVMQRTTRDTWQLPGTWRQFLARRLVRIVPLYWLLTAAKIGMLMLAPALFRNSALLPWNVVASFLFIPAWDAKHEISPVISAGWTLCFEMAFYAVFAACLFLRRDPAKLATPLLACCAVVGLWRQDGWGAPATLLDPLLLEFVAGMWLAKCLPSARSNQAILPLLGVACAALVALALSGEAGIEAGRLTRLLSWGVPSAILLASLVALEDRLPFGRASVLLRLGDASYSIYLTHVLALPAFLRLVRGLRGSLQSELGGLILLMACGVAAGLIVHRTVEVNLQMLVRRVLWPKPRSPARLMDAMDRP